MWTAAVQRPGARGGAGARREGDDAGGDVPAGRSELGPDVSAAGHGPELCDQNKRQGRRLVRVGHDRQVARVGADLLRAPPPRRRRRLADAADARPRLQGLDRAARQARETALGGEGPLVNGGQFVVGPAGGCFVVGGGLRAGAAGGGGVEARRRSVRRGDAGDGDGAARGERRGDDAADGRRRRRPAHAPGLSAARGRVALHHLGHGAAHQGLVHGQARPGRGRRRRAGRH
mmetsp:Transcript_3648/g.11267  ORF Transcript_3648/g.11267 Transcript_3648/m.11267 type:complete len:232 (+) Transcript_3648:2382-3077(+)